MNDLPPELVEAPSAWCAILTDNPSGSALAASLRAANEATGPRTRAARVALRFVVRPSTHGFAPKLRSHADDATATREVAGVLPDSWLRKHHEEIPAVALVVLHFDTDIAEVAWVAVRDAALARWRAAHDALAPRGIPVFALALWPQEDASTSRSLKELSARRLQELRPLLVGCRVQWSHGAGASMVGRLRMALGSSTGTPGHASTSVGPAAAAVSSPGSGPGAAGPHTSTASDRAVGLVAAAMAPGSPLLLTTGDISGAVPHGPHGTPSSPAPPSAAVVAAEAAIRSAAHTSLRARAGRWRHRRALASHGSLLRARLAFKAAQHAELAGSIAEAVACVDQRVVVSHSRVVMSW